MRALGLSIALAWSIAAWALVATFLVGCATALTHTRPPAAYIGKPASATIIVDNQTQVTSMCRAMGVSGNPVACANPTVMVMPDPCEYTGVYAEMMCHEVGHVLGWSKDHTE